MSNFIQQNSPSHIEAFIPLSTKDVFLRILLMAGICVLGFIVFVALLALVPSKHEDFALLVLFLFTLFQSVISFFLSFLYFKLRKPGLTRKKAKFIVKIPFFMPLYSSLTIAGLFILMAILDFGTHDFNRDLGFVVTSVGTFCYSMLAHQVMHLITSSEYKDSDA